MKVEEQGFYDFTYRYTESFLLDNVRHAVYNSYKEYVDRRADLFPDSCNIIELISGKVLVYAFQDGEIKDSYISLFNKKCKISELTTDGMTFSDFRDLSRSYDRICNALENLKEFVLRKLFEMYDLDMNECSEVLKALKE